MDTIDEHATEILLDGRYRLGPCLGRGGMAVVYRAEDTFLGRTVAIKLLGQADEAPSATERVHSETTVLASLNHPSLVTLYDARLDPGHAQYLAMEYIDGPSLASRLAQGPLSDPDAATLARDLSEALQVVHDAGIIHRDVKPSNVMLARASRREAGWTAKLTDFGIAYSLSDPRVTSPGVVVGTAAYMAPEQVRGAELTPAVDIYSLGLVLIEALTGEPAFPVMGKVPTALRRLAEAPAIPDSVGPRWGALLTHMTHVAPEERPSASEVAQAAAFLCAAPPLEGGGTAEPHPAPTVLMPITTDGPTTGPTQQMPVAAAPPTARRRVARKLRAAALSTMAVVAAAMIIVAGLWAFSPPGESPGRVASRMSADEVFTPPSPETNSPPESDQTDTSTSTDTESDISDEPGDDVTEGGPDENSDENPNKGPGNNSGNDKGSDDDKDDDKNGK